LACPQADAACSQASLACAQADSACAEACSACAYRNASFPRFASCFGSADYKDWVDYPPLTAFRLSPTNVTTPGGTMRHTASTLDFTHKSSDEPSWFNNKGTKQRSFELCYLGFFVVISSFRGRCETFNFVFVNDRKLHCEKKEVRKMDNPKGIEDKLTKVADAWETLRETKSFGGMTLEQFKAAIKPSFDARAEIKKLEKQIVAQQDIRDKADIVSMAAQAKVVKGVIGDADEGDDGELYEAMGYVRKSERASGLSRKKTTPPTT
jgi:hypothetical protein